MCTQKNLWSDWSELFVTEEVYFSAVWITTEVQNLIPIDYKLTLQKRTFGDIQRKGCGIDPSQLAASLLQF